MNSFNLNKTEGVVFPWNPYDGDNLQFETTFRSNNIGHPSHLQIISKPLQITLTKIACGVSSDVTKKLIEEFCERGVSMVVLDFNGLSHEECRTMVYDIRHGVFNYSLNHNNRVPYSLALALDLGEPSVVTGNIQKSKSEQRLILPTNGRVYVTNDMEYKEKCTADRIYVSSDKILCLRENDTIFLDNGKVELAVERVDSKEVLCLIKRGDWLGSCRAVHIPSVPVDTSAVLTKQHERNIRFGVQLKVDIIMVPRVRDEADLNVVREFVSTVDQENGDNIDLYVKIDNSVVLRNIDQIIRNADGVFLHRPDLYMEVGPEKIFLAQKTVLSKCNEVGKPTVTYGGFLESMEFNSSPTCTEISDVVSAVLDGTDCIYLDVIKRSACKADCIQQVSTICRQAEVTVREKRYFSEHKNQYKSKVDPIQGMSIGCVEVSLKSNAAAIIVVSASGTSAKAVSRYRPMCPVLAIVKHGTSARKISVWRNLTAVQYIDPIETDWSKEVEHRTKFAMDFGKKKGILRQGDLVIHMSSSKPNSRFPDSIQLFFVNAGDFIEDVF